MADKAAERIKYETELLRLVFVLVIAVAGGSLSLLLGSPTSLRLILAGAGILATLGLLFIGWRQHRLIRVLIDQIQEQS
jgi:hypothetical protein